MRSSSLELEHKMEAVARTCGPVKDLNFKRFVNQQKMSAGQNGPEACHVLSIAQMFPGIQAPLHLETRFASVDERAHSSTLVFLIHHLSVI